MTEQLWHFIDGKRVEGQSGRFGDIYNPATGEVAARAPLATAGEVDKAVRSAEAAFPDWSARPPAQRAQALFALRDLIYKHMDELAELISKQHGKTLADAKGSITRGVEVVEFACGIPHLLKGDYTDSVARGIDSYSVRQPLGVVAGITPFNFPAMIPLWMFPVAIACGNTFVMKPSERDPSCGLRLAELALEAGVPEGVVNVVNGDKEAVDAILEHPTIQGVSFVGSTNVAEYIYRTGASHGKRVQALGGAKNHMIVMPDADMDQATNALVGAGYGSAGERCMAVSVAVAVGEETGDELVKRLKPRVEELKIGPYTDPEAEMGPIVTRDAYERIQGYIAKGIEEGAELVVDGRNVRKPQGYENGFFMGGSLFDRVGPEMSIYKDEIFGPVLSVVRAKSYDDAIKLANDHEYGNGAAIFTRDGDAAREFARDARIGMIGVNVPIPVPAAYHSFGGWKRSLFGDHNMHGPEGVRFYTKQKTVTARWPSGIRSETAFHFRGSSEG